MKSVPTSFSSIIEPLEARIAPAAIVSANGKVVTWTDIDGDKATLHVSKSLFNANNVGNNPNDPNDPNDPNVLTFDTTGAQQQLLVIDFTKLGKAAADVNLTITAVKSANGDGLVNVGFIKAAVPSTELYAITKGIDLGVIKIQGDLGGLYAGDTYADAAVQKIKVQSWGALNATEQTAQNNGIIPTDLRSVTLAGIRDTDIAGNFDGTYGARLSALGAQFGKIGTLTIGGDLIGGAAEKSGLIFASNTIAHVEITGDIIGGSGSTSANLQGLMKTVHVGGSVMGGSGDFSARIISGGSIDSVKIGGNIEGGTGSSSGDLGLGAVQRLVIGTEGDLTKGNLTGGAGQNSARIDFTSAGTVKILGAVTGGSGVLSAHLGFTSAEKVTIGSIVGGTGGSSASIQFTSAQEFALTGSLTGGSGIFSGYVKGVVIGTLSIGDSLIGGSADHAGSIDTFKVKKLEIGQDIRGGSASFTGVFRASTKLGDGVIGGSILGGDAASGTVAQTGNIIGGRLQHLEIDGSITAGTASSGATLIASGAITATAKIGVLTIAGDVSGNAGTAALISAQGITFTNDNPAIKSLTIEGNVNHTNILAGYSPSTTNALGTAVNADAQIGTIKLGGVGKTISAINIVAGVTAGADGVFGTADDQRISGSNTVDRVNVASRIASIIIAGQVADGEAGRQYGVVADNVVKVQVGSTSLPLTKGANNDQVAQVIPGTTDFQVIEITPPTPQDS